MIVCPITVLPALPIQAEVMRPRPGRTYMGVFNCTGWPVVVMRCGTSPEGLPIGLQIVGQPWREDVVLAVSRHLEKEIGGWQKPAL